MLDVSDGFSTLENLTIELEIVPRFIPIQATNFIIKEGLSGVINEEIVNISDSFYRSGNIDFTLVEPPQHGEIRSLEGDELSYFTWDDVSTHIDTFYAPILRIMSIKIARLFSRNISLMGH